MLEWGGNASRPPHGICFDCLPPPAAGGSVGAAGPAIGQPVPGIRCLSVRSSTHLTLTARRTAPDSPKVQNAILGLPDRAKTSYTYAKVRLGRSGSAKVQKVQLFALLRFGPPRSSQNAVHVCKNAKVTFYNFSIF